MTMHYSPTILITNNACVQDLPNTCKILQNHYPVSSSIKKTCASCVCPLRSLFCFAVVLPVEVINGHASVYSAAS